MARYKKKNYNYSIWDNDDVLEGLGVLLLLFIIYITKFAKSHPLLFYVILATAVLIVSFVVYKVIMKRKTLKDDVDPSLSGRTDKSYKGNINEFEIYEMLNELSFYKKILKNIYVPVGNNRTSEIDIVMICTKGILVIESKNFNGKIYGKFDSKYWTLFHINRKKYRIYNPILQNDTHVDSVVKDLSIEKSIVESIVCFGQNSNTNKLQIEDSTKQIINNNQLIPLVNYLYNKRENVLSNEEVDQIYMKLRNYKYVDDSVKEKHIKNN